MTIRKANNINWREFNGADYWEPVPQTTPHMRIAHRSYGGFELWIYKYPLGSKRNCVGWFKTFKQAANAV